MIAVCDVYTHTHPSLLWARMKEMAKISAPFIAISRRLDRHELLLSMARHSASYFRRSALADMRLKIVEADNEQKPASPFGIPESVCDRGWSVMRNSGNLHGAKPGDVIKTLGRAPSSLDRDASCWRFLQVWHSKCTRFHIAYLPFVKGLSHLSRGQRAPDYLRRRSLAYNWTFKKIQSLLTKTNFGSRVLKTYNWPLILRYSLSPLFSHDVQLHRSSCRSILRR